MARPEDWPERLAAFVDSRRRTPFAEGDDASFALAAAEAITGRDLQASRPAVAPGEYEDLEAVATAILGPPVDNVLYLRRGDVALAENGNELLLMVCVGHELAGPGMDGVFGLPLTAAVKFWRVG